jgi:phosphate transport system substrate-binding protein
VKEFISFYLKNAKNLVADVGYIPLTDEEYDLEINKFNEFIK